MSLPTVVAVAPHSAAQRAGVAVGDVVTAINGLVPRDVIEWRFAADDAEVVLEVQRGGLEITIEVLKRAGEPLGAEVSMPQKPSSATPTAQLPALSQARTWTYQ